MRFPPVYVMLTNSNVFSSCMLLAFLLKRTSMSYSLTSAPRLSWGLSSIISLGWRYQVSILNIFCRYLPYEHSIAVFILRVYALSGKNKQLVAFLATLLSIRLILNTVRLLSFNPESGNHQFKHLGGFFSPHLWPRLREDACPCR